MWMVEVLHCNRYRRSSRRYNDKQFVSRRPPVTVDTLREVAGDIYKERQNLYVNPPDHLVFLSYVFPRQLLPNGCGKKVEGREWGGREEERVNLRH